MKNLPQVTKGQLIRTPHGEGFLAFCWHARSALASPMQVGEQLDQVAYFVYLLTGRDPVYGYPLYEAHELRALNPGVYFPAHKGEILRKEQRHA